MATATTPLISNQGESHVVETDGLHHKYHSHRPHREYDNDLPPADKACLEELRKSGIIAKPTIMVSVHIIFDIAAVHVLVSDDPGVCGL
jgi:hypothetical protein